MKKLTLKSTSIDTKFGPMIAIADEHGLYLLEFSDRVNLENKMNRLRKKMCAAINPGDTIILRKISTELTRYSDGENFKFETPVVYIGSDFQKNVWNALRKIPLGETRSYLDIAKSVKNPRAYRAVANANGANTLAIIIPCHRVINANGELGGYAGGVTRKQRLLRHEANLR